MLKDLWFRRILKHVFFLSFLPLMVFSTPAFCVEDCDLDISIDIAPNVLNMESGGRVVTVHTDIDYDEVDPKSVYLISNGDSVGIKSWKADDRGNFVAKFPMSDIKMLEALDIGEFNTFTLVGETVHGETFCGEQDIMVIDIKAEKEKRQEEKQEMIRSQLNRCD